MKGVKVEAKEFTPELLQKTAELLKKNPEYYTVWNHRRRIFNYEFDNIHNSTASGELEEHQRISQTLDLLHLDLQFLVPLLLKFPKCYWIWNHRLWLLERASVLLPRDNSLALWAEELGLVGKMLNRDSRNFHGWGYRRTVVDNIERLKSTSMAKDEFDYTTKMIGINLSNFSAWHNRSKLILRILDEQSASNEERKQMLDDGQSSFRSRKQLGTHRVQNCNSSTKHCSIHMISPCGSITRTLCALSTPSLHGTQWHRTWTRPSDRSTSQPKESLLKRSSKTLLTVNGYTRP